MSKLKKLLLSLPASLLLVFLLSGVASAAAAKTGVINGDSVNVRSKPDTSSSIVTQLNDSTKVTILSEEGDWYKISAEDNSGWVFKQYVKADDAAIATGTIVSSNTEVNVRSKPDISSEILEKLDPGTKVDVYEHSGDWYKILIAQGRYGWINKDYISVRSGTVSRGLTDDVTPPVKTNPSGSDIDKDGSGDKGSIDSSELRQQIVDYAKNYLGVRYKYGGTTPKGFDCSGFVQYVFKHFDISLERTAEDQGAHGNKVSKSELVKGDLVFFDTNGGLNRIEHVGIYIGNGKFIHASSGSSNHKVVISDLTSGFYDDSYMCSRDYLSGK